MKGPTRHLLALGILVSGLPTATLRAAGPTPAAPTAVAEPTAAEARRELLDVLVQNGFINRAQADALLAPAPPPVLPATKVVTKLALWGRVQTQFVAFSADADGPTDPADVQHFLLRRVYLGTKAELGPDWRAFLTYNFSNSLLDIATIQWSQPDFTVDVGYRMVNLGREQRTSSGALKAIERSAATRYFVESNNGTRLGAGSYRVGIFADGKVGDSFWGAAVTNPEQPTTLTTAAGSGDASNNRPALWLNGGHTFKTAGGSRLVIGAGLGWLPDQGGLAVGTGDDLLVGTLFSHYTAGRFQLFAEAFGADNPRGATDGSDARPFGGFIQPSWSFTPKLEGVFRIGYLDTDGRGITLRDALPSTPVTGAFDRLWDAYLGGTWYIQGNDLKLQAGLIYGRGIDTPVGADARIETYGFRSQMQVNF